MRLRGFKGVMRDHAAREGRPRFALHIQWFAFPLQGEDELPSWRSRPSEVPAPADLGAHTWMSEHLMSYRNRC